jgi:hypothetical protein
MSLYVCTGRDIPVRALVKMLKCLNYRKEVVLMVPGGECLRPVMTLKNAGRGW